MEKEAVDLASDDDLTRDVVDDGPPDLTPGYEEKKRLKCRKRKKAPQKGPQEIKKPRVSSVDLAKKTSGFRISRRVMLQNHRYIHLCTVFNQPLHFWSVVTYKNKTWIGGKENMGGMKLYGDEESIAHEGFMGTWSNPCIHAYALEEADLASSIDGFDVKH